MSRPLIAVAVSLALHAALAAVPALRGRRAAAAVAVEVQLTRLPRPRPATPTPPPRPPEARAPAKARPARRARPVQQVVVQRRTARSTAEEKPAPEPRPLGVTPSSVAPGGGGESVPIGSGDGQPGGRGTAPATGASAARAAPPAAVAAVTLRSRPRLLREHKVGYPEEARRQGVEGTVTLDVLVGEDGRVREVKVISGPGFGLNEAAQRALMRFVFAPAVYSDGRPRAHRIVYRYVFQID